MNQILDKLGIYDLTAVLLSGTIIVTFSVLTGKVLFHIELLDAFEVDNTLFFLVISYFVGLVFQELGSMIQKLIICRNNRLLIRALDTSLTHSHQCLTTEEMNSVYGIVKKELALEGLPNIAVLYNYCKYQLIINGDMSKMDRDQSIAGLSRSVSLYFFVLFVIVYLKAIDLQSTIYFGYAFVALMLSIMLGYRCARFITMRYVDIIRTFYYKYIQTQTQDDKSRSRKCISLNDCK